MKKYRSIILLGLCLVLPSLSFAEEPEENLSKIRIKAILDIIRKHTKNHESLGDDKVQERIIKEVKQKFPMPKEKPDLTTIKEIAKEVKEKTKNKFPKSIKEVKQQAIADAAEKDLPEEEKKKWIDETVREYYREKGSYMNKLFLEIRSNIITTNEAKGYIYGWDEWFTPEQAAKKLIMLVLMKKNEPAYVLKKTDNPRMIKVGDKVYPFGLEPGHITIEGSRYGIDADQGFNYKGEKRILWGMKQDDCNLILKGLISEGLNTPVETIKYKDGLIKEAKLYFLNGLFYKVQINFHCKDKEKTLTLWQVLNEKYGESIEAKKMRKEGAPEPPPLKQTYTWKGQITEGKLHIELTPDREGFSKFELTKEYVDIKKKADE